jgi:hypothetical protein
LSRQNKDITRNLSRLIAAGDRQGIVRLYAEAEKRGEDTEPYVKALNEAVAVYLKKAPPVDPPID